MCDEEKRENTGKTTRVYSIGRRRAVTPGLSLGFVLEGPIERQLEVALSLLRCAAVNGVLRTSGTASKTEKEGLVNKGSGSKHGYEK